MNVSVYSTGAEAFRDTTKWLVAFVPIATIVATAGLLGPHLLSNAAASDSPWAWTREHVWPLVGIATVVAGVVLVVSFGAKVLTAQAKDVRRLLTKDEEKLSSAFSAGVGAPYFLDDRAFRNAVASLDERWSTGSQVSESELTRVVAATDMLRGWALHDALASSFRRFQIWFGVGVALIVVGLISAAVVIAPTGAAIEQPTVVQVTLAESGAQDLRNKTGCQAPTETEFVAVAGTWGAPVLEADGLGCKFRARWRPEPQLIELRIPGTG